MNILEPGLFVRICKILQNVYIFQMITDVGVLIALHHARKTAYVTADLGSMHIELWLVLLLYPFPAKIPFSRHLN